MQYFRKVNRQDAIKFAKSLNCELFESSAREGWSQRIRETHQSEHRSYLSPPINNHRSTTPPLLSATSHPSCLNEGQRSRSRSFHNLSQLSTTNNGDPPTAIDSKKKIKKSNTLFSKLSPIPRRKSVKLKRGVSSTVAPQMNILNPLLSSAKLAGHIGVPIHRTDYKKNILTSNDVTDSSDSNKTHSSSDSESGDHLPHTVEEVHYDIKEGIVSEPFLYLLRSRNLENAKVRPRSPTSVIRSSLKKMTRSSLKHDHH